MGTIQVKLGSGGSNISPLRTYPQGNSNVTYCVQTRVPLNYLHNYMHATNYKTDLLDHIIILTTNHNLQGEGKRCNS